MEQITVSGKIVLDKKLMTSDLQLHQRLLQPVQMFEIPSLPPHAQCVDQCTMRERIPGSGIEFSVRGQMYDARAHPRL